MFVKLWHGSSSLLSTGCCRFLHLKQLPPLPAHAKYNNADNSRGFRSTAEEANAVRTKAGAAASASSQPDHPIADDLLTTGASSIVPVSLTNIRKTVRNGGFEISDGYSCLRTVCPACEATPTTPSSTAVFINKTTGSFLCPTCQIVRSWPAIEACFQRPTGSAARALRDYEAIKEGFRKAKEPLTECKADANALPIERLAEAVVVEVLTHLRIQVKESERGIRASL